MNDTELKVINFFRQNPTLSITQIAKELNISRAIASKYINRNENVLLGDGRTIKEQLEYNKEHGASNGAIVKNTKDQDILEKKVVDYFKKNQERYLDDIAEKFGIAKSTVSKYLNKHKNEMLDNGFTIERQLRENQNRGRQKGASIIGNNSIAIKNDKGRFTGSISTISGLNFLLVAPSGERVGSITVTDKMYEKIIREAIFYLVHNFSLEKAAEELSISKRTLQLHLKKLEVCYENIYRLVKEKKKNNQIAGRASHVSKGGKTSMYDQGMVNNICDKMLQNGYTYQEASEILDIPSSTLFELMKRVDEKRRTDLEVLATANRKNQSINKYLEEHERKRK